MPGVEFNITGTSTDIQAASKQAVDALERLSKQAFQTSAALKTIGTGSADIDKNLRSMGRSVDDSGRSFDRLHSSVFKTNQGFALLGNVMGLLKWPAMITGAGLAAQGIGALATAAVALAGAMGPLTGLMAAMPVAMGTIGASLATVKLAFSGFSEAMTKGGDALKKLSPAARELAVTLKGLEPTLKNLRAAAGEDLFPGLTTALKSVLTKENLSAVTNGLRGMGDALGDAAKSFAAVFSTKSFSADLVKLFDQFQAIVRTAGVAAGNFALALVNIMVSARPLMDFLSQTVLRFSAWAKAATDAGRASGDLNRFFESTVSTLKQFGAILGPLGAALINVFKAAKPVTDALMADLATVMQRFRDFTASASGQNSIRQYFEDMLPAIREIGRLILALGEAFIQVSRTSGFENLVRQVRVELLPAITTLLVTTTQQLGPAFISLVTNVARVLTSLAGATGPLTALLKILGDLAGAVADFLEGHDRIRTMVVDLTSALAILKAFSVVAGILKGVAAAFFLIPPAAKAGATATTVASAQQVAALRAVMVQATVTSAALRGMNTIQMVGILGNLGKTATAVGKVGTTARLTSVLFGPWGMAIAAAALVAMPYLDRLEAKIRSITSDLPSWTGLNQDDYDRQVEKVIGTLPGKGASGPGTNDRTGNDTRGKGTGRSTSGQLTLPTFGPGTVYGTVHHNKGRTTGLEEWGATAHDFMAKAGTTVLAPEDGFVEKKGQSNWHDPAYWGASIYYRGAETGSLYYIKHITESHAPVGSQHRRGDAIAIVAAGTQGGDHAHVGVQAGPGVDTGTPVDTPTGTWDPDKLAAPQKSKLTLFREAVQGAVADDKLISEAEFSAIETAYENMSKKLQAAKKKIFEALRDRSIIDSVKLAFKEALKDGILDAGEIQSLVTQFEEMPERLQKSFKKSFDASLVKGIMSSWKQAFKDGISMDELTGMLDAFAALPERVQDKIRKGFDANVVKAAMQSFKAAFKDGISDEELAQMAEIIERGGARVEKATRALFNAAYVSNAMGAFKKAMADNRISDDEWSSLIGKLDSAPTDAIYKKLRAAFDPAIVARALGEFKKALRDNRVTEEELLGAADFIDEWGLQANKKVTAAFASMSAVFVKEAQKTLGPLKAEFEKMLKDGLISEEAADKIKDNFAVITDLLKGGLGPNEVKPFAEAFNAIKEGVGAAAEELARAVPKFKQFAVEFDAVFADGLISPAELDLIEKSAGKIPGVIGDALEQAIQAVRDARSNFDRAFGEFRSAVEAAFREQVIAKFQLTIDFASIELAAEEARVALESATAKWNAAISEGMDTGAETVRAAVERALAANAEYTAAIISQDRERIKAAIVEKVAANAALAALDTTGMGERAAAILSAGQGLIAAQATIDAGVLAQAKQGWETAKTEALQGVLAVVDTVAEQLRNGEITWGEAVSKIGTALTNAGMEAGAASELLGSAVATGMAKAVVAMETAISSLVTAINNLVAVLGGAVVKAQGDVREMEKLKLRSDQLAAATAANAQAPGVQHVDPAPTGADTGPYTGPQEVVGGGPQGATQHQYTQSSAPHEPAPPASQGHTPLPPASGHTSPQKPILMPEYATGGIAEFPQIARIAERFQEAIIPMPSWMDSGLKTYLSGLATGGWRFARASGGGRRGGGGGHGGGGVGGGLPTIPGISTAGLLALGTGGLGATPSKLAVGGPTIPPPIMVQVTMPNYLGTAEQAARELAVPIRDALSRIGANNVTIFGRQT